MDSRTRAGTPAEDLRTLEDLSGLSGVLDVQPFAGGYSVVFPEADFVISLSNARPDQRCETDWEVTVREPQPGLSTWWGRWHRSFSVHRSEAGPLIAQELREARIRVHDMLEDHARVTQDA